LNDLICITDSLIHHCTFEVAFRLMLVKLYFSI